MDVCVDVLILTDNLLAFEGSILYLLMLHLNYLKKIATCIYFQMVHIFYTKDRI